MAASSIPSVVAESLYFVENGAAGTYTGQIVAPAGATLLDVLVHGEALWTAGTSATLIVGDTVDDDGIFIGVNLKATDLLAAESLSTAFQGGKQGADVDAVAAGMQVRRRLTSHTAERTFQAKVTTVGTAGTAGRTRVIFVFCLPVNSTTITQ